MKLSELIKGLEAILQKYGDFEAGNTETNLPDNEGEEISDNPQDISKLRIEIPIYYDLIKDELKELKDFKPFIKKHRRAGMRTITFDIDIDTGIITDWVKETGGKKTEFFYKAVDNGIYTLFDSKGRVIKSIEGYVPNGLIPDKDGYGDYITLKIDEHGKIRNWYDPSERSFEEFFEYEDDDTPDRWN
jgi:hypothetical protein